MRIWDSVVVGSGPAGVAAIEALLESEVLLIEAGKDPKDRKPSLSADFRDGLFEVAPKLRGLDFQDLRRGDSISFLGGRHKRDIRLPLSPGGYSTAWGAQLFPFSHEDIAELGDWPISREDLTEAYSWFLSTMNFVGGSENTESFFGLRGNANFEPLPLSRLARGLLARTASSYTGPLQLGPALLALDRNAKSSDFYSAVGEEFGSFSPQGMTTAFNRLQRILPEVSVNFETRVIHFDEHKSHVDVHVQRTGLGPELIRTRKLFLGLGTVATTRLILQNSGQFGRAVPFVEHSPHLLPMFDPLADHHNEPSKPTFPVMLNGFLDTGPRKPMVAIYNPASAPLKTLAHELRVSEASLSKLGRDIIQRFAVAQIWSQTRWDEQSTMVVEKNAVTVRSFYKVNPKVVGAAARELRKLGYLAFRMVSKSLGPGWGFHWVGTLPMREHPKELETFSDGRLWNSKRVFVIDGSVIPSLPSKNHSLTIMSNAYRVAKGAR
jgi:choline dehydrogenase-like flavoprotein